MELDSFLDEMRDYIHARNAMMNHPFMKLLMDGKLTRDQVAAWARQFWVIPHTHMVNNAGKLARLAQDGWQLGYEHYPAAEQGGEPRRIELSNGTSRIRMVIDSWRREQPVP